VGRFERSKEVYGGLEFAGSQAAISEKQREVEV
jgi:hypothetical protein